jgi:hypothetical protein
MFNLTGRHENREQHGQQYENSQQEHGRYGSTATVQVEPRRLGSVHTSYSPQHDGQPDPGEIVWTWVPFEENDGRGKDRPVLIVARERTGTLLAVELTSKRHDAGTGADVAEWVALGAGPWDREARASWANLERIFCVHPAGMRREASALDHPRFLLVAERLRHLYGW